MLIANDALTNPRKNIDAPTASLHTHGMQPNMFLEGNFAPIKDEFTLEQKTDFEIKGKIPKDLNGSLFRVGPNPAQEQGPNYHWFLGDGMVHAFHFSRGNVTYRNRYAQTPGYKIERSAGKNLFLGAGFNLLATLQLLGGNIVSLLSGLVRHGNADVYTKLLTKANTAILSFREQIFALTESSPPFKLNPFTLESEGFEDFAVNFEAPFTAHPKVDPRTGYLYAFGYRVSGKPKLEYYVINPSGKLISRTAIDIPYYAMVHDFIITRNYVVIPIFPAVASLAALKRGRLAEWQADKESFAIVLAKNGDLTSLRRFTLPQGYVYHYANAFDDGKEIIFDAARYDALPLMGDDSESRSELFGRKNNAFLTRFKLLLDSGQVDVSPLSQEHYIEFPTIDPRLVGEKYERTFAAAARATSTESAGVFDSQVCFQFSKSKMRTEVTEFPSGHFGGEPIFAPTGKPGEASGYLLNVIYNSHTETSYLAIYDAARIDKKPICEVRLPHRIPYGFHGLWKPTFG